MHLFLIILFLLVLACNLQKFVVLLSDGARADQKCLDDDYTNDLPVFIEKKSICNYETVPVPVYSIRTTPKYDDAKFCLKGDVADAFEITDGQELKFVKNLEGEQNEVRLKVQIIRITDLPGTDGERRQAVNAIEFVITILDCNQVSWQTVLVAVLSSVCVIMMSCLAILLILYHQRGLRSSDAAEQDEKRDRDADSSMSYSRPSDETFINPRRTSSIIYNQS